MTEKIKISASEKALALVEKYELTKEAFMAKLQKQFKFVVKEFFKSNKNIKAITWAQYTPHFNDGEPCEFGVGDMWVLSKKGYKEWQENGGYPEDFDVNSFEDDDFSKEDLEEVESFVGVLRKIPSEVYLGMFGDHVQIVVTKNEISVEDYEHD